MSFGKQVLFLVVIGCLGLWGCAQGPTAAHAERIRALETKIGKLEEDFKTAVAGRDQWRKKLTTAEEEKTLLSQQVEDLRQQLVVRTTERDTIQNQFVQFRKGIKTLLGQADTASNALAQPVTSTAAAPPGKS